MINEKAFKADLQNLYDVIAKDRKEALAKKKELCEKLNNQEYNEVIHALFSKNDILKILSKTSVSVGVVARKDAVEAAVKEAINNCNFKTAFVEVLLDKIDDIGKNPALLENFMAKYGIKMNKEGGFAPGTDPEIVKIMGNFDASQGVNIVTVICRQDYDVLRETIENGVVTVKENSIDNIDKLYTMEIHGKDLPDAIKVEVRSGEFYEWMTEHFLVKDVQGHPGSASFELDY